MKLIDLHTHCHYSSDADQNASVLDDCEAAIQHQVSCFALTDHFEIHIPVYQFDPVAREKEIREARDRMGDRVEILTGLEIGGYPFDPKEGQETLQKIPYDVVLGSQHYLEEIGDFYDLEYSKYSDEELKGFWMKYHEILYQQACETPMDVQTHIRYPERYFIYSGREKILDLEHTAKEFFEPILQKLIQRDIALEINTSVVRKSGHPADPGVELLKFYRSLGGKYITVGSDAHRPADFGADLVDALAMAEAAGFEYIACFKQRKMYLKSIQKEILI